MIDYVTLMLLNMAAALALLGLFLLVAFGREDNKGWAVPFGVSGFVAAVTGFVMTFTWPLPSPYNIAFGEMSVLLGMLLLGAALAVARGWDLFPLCCYAFFAGLAAVVVGVRFIDLSLTRTPVLSGAGFILTGLCGMCSGIVAKRPKVCWLRGLGGVALFVAAAIWLYIGIIAFWGHLKVN